VDIKKILQKDFQCRNMWCIQLFRNFIKDTKNF